MNPWASSYALPCPLYGAYSECLPTRLNPLAERACSSQAGGAAGVVSRTLTAPLNVLKIAMQADQVRSGELLRSGKLLRSGELLRSGKLLRGQVSAGTGLAAAVAQVRKIPRRRLAPPYSLHKAY